MKSWPRTLLDGAGRGAVACARLMAIIAPVYTLMAVLKYLNVLQVVADWCRPAMRYFGLPGDAAFALVLGNFLNLYAAIGVISHLRDSALLAGGQLTLLSLMLLISHSQILESSVFFQIKTKYGVLWLVRLVTALLVGYGLHFLIAPAAGTPALVSALTIPSLTLQAAAIEYARGLLSLALKMLVILLAIFIVLEVVKRLRLLEKSSTPESGDSVHGAEPRCRLAAPGRHRLRHRFRRWRDYGFGCRAATRPEAGPAGQRIPGALPRSH